MRGALKHTLGYDLLQCDVFEIRSSPRHYVRDLDTVGFTRDPSRLDDAWPLERAGDPSRRRLGRLSSHVTDALVEAVFARYVELRKDYLRDLFPAVGGRVALKAAPLDQLRSDLQFLNDRIGEEGPAALRSWLRRMESLARAEHRPEALELARATLALLPVDDGEPDAEPRDAD